MSNLRLSENQRQSGWYERGYVPHFEGGSIPQMVTFRLHRFFPEYMLERSGRRARCIESVSSRMRASKAD
jgi:hypothetical protein